MLCVLNVILFHFNTVVIPQLASFLASFFLFSFFYSHCANWAIDYYWFPRSSLVSPTKSALKTSCFISFAHFLPLGLYFLLLSFESSLYVLGDKSFIDYVIWKYFLPAYTCLFILFTLSFTEQTLLFQWSLIYQSFFVYYMLLYQRTLCLRYVHEDFLL